jgi:hypothetical protein
MRWQRLKIQICGGFQTNLTARKTRNQLYKQTLSLPPGPTKGQAQQVPGLDGEVRILRRAASPACLGGCHAAKASGVTHTVKLPRCWSARSYSGQLATW